MMLSFGDGPTPGNESDVTETYETHASYLPGLIMKYRKKHEIVVILIVMTYHIYKLQKII